MFTLSLATASAQGISIFGINIFSGCGGAPYDKCRAEVQVASDTIGDQGGLAAPDTWANSTRVCKEECRD